MRRPLTRKQLLAQGVTSGAIRWKLESGHWQQVSRGVYVIGPESPTAIERALANVVATGGVATGTLAGLLHELDGVRLCGPNLTLRRRRETVRTRARQRDLPELAVGIVQGYRCAEGLATVLELSAVLNDVQWEQALESALRKRLCTVADIERALTVRRRGNKRMRRVLRARPDGAPPTESMLETLFLQLIRSDPGIPTPERQVEVLDDSGNFCGRVDLAFVSHGVFIELDGQQHKDQPVYDASRQTRIVAATGWLVGRFTWHEVVRQPATTKRRLRQLLAVAVTRSA